MDIIARINAYDSTDGGHSDAAQGSAYELMAEAQDEIERLRAVLNDIIDLDHHSHAPESRATIIARAALNRD